MPVTDLHIGTTLLDYEIEAMIGRGGMGVVYRARERALDRNVALKVIAPELAASPEFRDRFLAESRLAASLEDDNVVPIYAAGDQDGHLYLAMRYIEGRDLKQDLAEGTLTPARTIAICGQVASALDAAHERGLVHRDVKPSNILLDARDHAYLADFGLTRLQSELGHAPMIGSSLGTVEYVAPEQIRGDALDGRADVYSLGCVLHECLTGSPPFSQRPEVALLYAHLEETPPAPPGLEHVMARALAKDADDRYATCTELVEAAAQALGVSRPRRRRWPVVAGALAAVAVAVVVALQVGSGPVPAQAAPTGRLLQLNPDTGAIVRTIPIGAEPTGVAVGGGTVWAAAYASHELWTVDPRSGAVATVDGVPHPISLAATRQAAYVVDDNGGPYRITPRQGAQIATIVLKNGHPMTTIGDPMPIAAGPGGVWGLENDSLYQVAQPLTGFVDQAARKVTIPAIENEERSRDRMSGLAVGKHAVWVIGDVGDTRLWRVGIAPKLVPHTFALGFDPAGVAVGFGRVWVTGQISNMLYEIDAGTGKVLRTIQVGREPMGVAVGAGSVWVANALDGTISKVDPRTGRTVTTIRVGGSPTHVAVGAGSVWVVADAA